MKLLRRYLDFVAVGCVAGGFALVASQRLGSVPVPDSGDEAMILQVPYELIHRGEFAWPMYQLLGGNIEHVWHSLRPVYYFLLTGFFEVFGWGLLQGRAFNLTAAMLLLVVLYLIGRRLFDWRVAMIAVIGLVCDQTFLERSRMIRNETIATALALLAFYLYEVAEEKQKGVLFVAAGIAAGAGVMCHTTILYVPVVVLVLMLLRRRSQVFSDSRLYLFLAGILAVMAYEVVYDVVDYKNLQLQYRSDRAHFPIASLWENLTSEPLRYQRWWAGAETYPIANLSEGLLHVVQLIVVGAVAYAVIFGSMRARRGNAGSDPRIRIWTATLVTVIFFAVATGPKRKAMTYMVYIAPWLMLCIGIMARELFDSVTRLKANGSNWRYRIAMGLALILLSVFAVAAGRTTYRYLKLVNSPDIASFEDFRAALREIVPDGTCPASVLFPVVWLAFPESDRCYITIEGRMVDDLELDGKDYTLLVPTMRNPWIGDPDAQYHFLGSVKGTPYGDFRAYYTGSDPQRRTIQPRSYQFFGNRRGYVNEQQVSEAREVLSLEARELSNEQATARHTSSGESSPNEAMRLCSATVKPFTVYVATILIAGPTDRWEIEVSGRDVVQVGERPPSPPGEVSRLFKTSGGERIDLHLRSVTEDTSALPAVTRVSLREVTQVLSVTQ